MKKTSKKRRKKEDDFLKKNLFSIPLKFRGKHFLGLAQLSKIFWSYSYPRWLCFCSSSSPYGWVPLPQPPAPPTWTVPAPPSQEGGWGCCSSYGFCVGPNSGWKCSGKLATLGNPHGSCSEDGDCPQGEDGGERCCGEWGWCTMRC